METPDGGQDVIGNGGDRPDRPPLFGWASPRVSVLVVAALAIGLVVGYLGGRQQAGKTAPTRPTATAPTSTATSPTIVQSPAIVQSPTAVQSLPPSLIPALAATGDRCAVQHGKTLELGVQVTNQSDRTIVMGRFRAVLPLGGLRETAVSVGTCGALPGMPPGSATLAAGTSEWLTISFDVLVRCPQPYPVQFAVSYTDSGKPVSAQLDEFPDLGQVTFSSCPTAQ